VNRSFYRFLLNQKEESPDSIERHTLWK